jgi:hypothetical protein
VLQDHLFTPPLGALRYTRHKQLSFAFSTLCFPRGLNFLVIARSRRYISIHVSHPCSPCKDVRAILKGIAFFYYGFMVFWWCCCDVVSWSHGAGLLGIWYGAMRGYLPLHLYFSILKKLSTGAMRGYLLWVMCIFLNFS